MENRFVVTPKDKVYGCYRIKDMTEDKYISLNGETVFKTKCLDKAVETRMRLEQYIEYKENQTEDK